LRNCRRCTRHWSFSQTTLKLQTFLEVAEAVRAKADAEPQVVNTICSASAIVRTPRGHSPVWLTSSTLSVASILRTASKLLAVCKEQCERSFLIETESEIDPEDLERRGFASGVTAGASTPNWLIDQVVKRPARETAKRTTQLTAQ